MGEIGGDAALNGICHGKNDGCGYNLDSNAAAVWLANICGVNIPNDVKPEYKLDGSGKPALCIVAPTNDDGDNGDDLFNSSCSCFIFAKIFW